MVRAVCGAGKSGQGKSGQTEEIETDLVVAADGLRSKARAWAGLEKSKSMAALGQGRPRRFGVRRHFGVEPWSDRVEVHWSTGVEAYVTPCGPREVGIAVLFEEGALEPDLEPTLEPTRRSWERARTEPRGPALERLLVRFPALMRRLEGAEPTSKVRGIGPLWQETRAVQSGPVVLLGDASGYVDAITGEGMAIAFRQALALGAAFRDGRVERYAKAHRRLVRRPEWMTRLVLLLSSRPALRGRVLRALARDPALFDRLLAIHVGAAKPLGVVSSVARLGLGLAGAR